MKQCCGRNFNLRRCQRTELIWSYWPFCHDHIYQPLLLVLFLLLTFVPGIFSYLEIINPTLPSEFELVRGPNGEMIQRVSLTALQQELAGYSSKLYWEVNDLLLSAEQAIDIDDFKKGAELYSQASVLMPVPNMFYNTAILYLQANLPSQALEHFEQAKAALSRFEDINRMKSEIAQGMAFAYGYLGETTLSSRYFLEAASIEDKEFFGYKAYNLAMSVDISIVADLSKELAKIETAAELVGTRGANFVRAQIFLGASRLFYASKDFDRTFRLLIGARQQLLNQNNSGETCHPCVEGVIFESLVNLYMVTGRFSEVHQVTSHVIPIAVAQEMYQEALFAARTKALVFAHFGFLGRSRELLEFAELIAIQTSESSELAKVYSVHSKIFAALNSYELAEKYCALAVSSKDSVPQKSAYTDESVNVSCEIGSSDCQGYDCQCYLDIAHPLLPPFDDLSSNGFSEFGQSSSLYSFESFLYLSNLGPFSQNLAEQLNDVIEDRAP